MEKVFVVMALILLSLIFCSAVSADAVQPLVYGRMIFSPEPSASDSQQPLIGMEFTDEEYAGAKEEIQMVDNLIRSLGYPTFLYTYHEDMYTAKDVWQEIRGVLRSMDPEGFFGNPPIVWCELDDDYEDYYTKLPIRSEYPCDIPAYMDLTNNIPDADNDGMLDLVPGTGDPMNPDIWFGRLTFTGFRRYGLDPVQILKSYLRKYADWIQNWPETSKRKRAALVYNNAAAEHWE